MEKTDIVLITPVSLTPSLRDIDVHAGTGTETQAIANACPSISCYRKCSFRSDDYACLSEFRDMSKRSKLCKLHAQVSIDIVGVISNQITMHAHPNLETGSGIQSIANSH